VNKSVQVVLFLLLSLWQIPTMAQFQGATNRGLGILGTAHNNLFSSNINPAISAQIDSNQIGLSFQKTGFTGRALEAGLQAKFSVKNIAMHAGLNNFGNAYYNFSKINYGISIMLAPNQSLGVGVNYFSQYNYLEGNSNGITVNAGYLLQLNSAIKLGVAFHQIANVSNSNLKNYANTIANHGSLGLEIVAQKELVFYPEVVVYQTNKPRLAFGAKYQKEKYALLCGIANYEGIFNAGVQIPIKNISLTLSYGFYERLGSLVSGNLVYVW
jgi:hypothetical protein